MKWHSEDILSILDACCESYTFPMLDNGYVYPAATRLSLYRSSQDWALVIEVFGFSPRCGLPDTQIYTFASNVQRTKSSQDYVTRQAYETYLANNKHNESTFIFPIEEGEWLDAENPEIVADGQQTVLVRENEVRVPQLREYGANGIALQSPPSIHVFELCRMLAASNRNSVLATPEERRTCILPELWEIMQLDEWNHPDLVGNERPSSNATFRSLAAVLVSGDVSLYQPSGRPNAHWKNWPEGGTL